MTKPRVIVSGAMGARELDDGTYAELGYQGLDGLFEPAMVAKGASIATFDGMVRIRPQATYYEPRTFSLYGYLIGGSGQAEMEQTAHDFFSALSGPNTRFHVGSLYLDCNVTARPRYDRFKDFTSRRDYRLECEAIPALWGSEYHQSVGGSQGILVRDDRLDHASIKMTDVTANGRVVQFTYGGSAPTRCALMISGVTSGTTYYIVNPYDGRAVAFTPSAAVHYIPASAGPWLYLANSGANVLRLQSDTSGTLVASGTYLWALVPSAFTTRYLGNDGNKMTEGPVFSFYRRGVGTYYTAAGVVSTGGDMAARIGVPVGAWTAAKAGLVLEQANTNKLTYSEDLSHANWTKTGAPTFASSATLLPNGGTAQEVTDANAGVGASVSQAKTAGDGEYWVKSIWMKKEAVGGLYPALEIYFSGGATPKSILAIVNSFAGTAFLYSATGEVAVHDAGADYWRVELRGVNNATGNTSVTASYWPCLSTDGTTLSGAATGTKTAGGAQLELGPFATSYIKTTSDIATRNADYAGLYRPHNYLKYSRDLTQTSAWITVSGCTVTRAGTVADGTASGSTVTFSATPTDDKVYQAVTPDCRPNSTPWTAVVALRQGTLTGSNDFYLRIDDQSGNLIGSAVTVTASDLSATETRTYFVSVTAAQVGSDDTGFQVAILGKTGAGTVIVESIGLLKGSFPGAPAHTEGSAIPLPQYGYDWPDWCSQNGYVEFKAVLPPISTGLVYGVFGGTAATSVVSPALFRTATATTEQNYLTLMHLDNTGVPQTSVDINVGAIWDGTAKTFKIWWRNYTSGGTQYMYLGLDVDGVNKSTSANVASATVTSWATPERLVLSLSEVMATLRNVTFGAYAVPAGAIPAT